MGHVMRGNMWARGNGRQSSDKGENETARTPYTTNHNVCTYRQTLLVTVLPLRLVVGGGGQLLLLLLRLLLSRHRD